MLEDDWAGTAADELVFDVLPDEGVLVVEEEADDDNCRSAEEANDVLAAVVTGPAVAPS